MMSSSRTGIEVRAWLRSKAGRHKGRGAGYGEQARRAAAQYVQGRRREGAGLAEVARELGVSWATLRKWVEASREAESGFIPVMVTTVSAATSFTLVSPEGWRVEGLDLPTVRALVGNKP